MTDQPTTPEAEQQDSTDTTVYRVYLGERVHSKTRKLIQAWTPPMDSPTGTVQGDDQWIYWEKTKFTGFTAGEVAAFVLTDGGSSTYTSGKKGPKYEAMYADPVKVAEWRALHKVAKQTDALRRQRAKAVAVDTLLEGLLPLRRAYRKASAEERAALLILAIQYVKGK